jgi:hypothetical protein
MIDLIHGSSEDKARKSSGAGGPCPEGTYTATISKAEGRESPFENMKTPDNPRGLVVTLWFDIETGGQRYKVFEDIAVTRIMRLNELLDACALPHIDTATKRFEESNLEGREILLRVWHSQNGRAKAGDFIRPTQQRTTATAAKPGRKAVQPGADGIPF